MLIDFDFAMLLLSILSYNGAEIIIGEWAYDLQEEIGKWRDTRYNWERGE